MDREGSTMSVAAPPVFLDDAKARRNVLRLAFAQALAGANSSVIFATGSIVGAMFAPDKSLATVPLTAFVVGMASGTLPTGWIARNYGRRAAFVTGAGVGVVTGISAAVAMFTASFYLFCFAALCSGFYAAVVQSFRFAVTDGVRVDMRARFLSWVMAGGVFAGVLGPQLVTWTMDLWSPYLFAASFAVQALVAILAMYILSGVELPRPRREERKAGRPLGEIIRQPLFVAAAICGVSSHVLMNLVMTSTPLAMKFCGLSVADSNWTIQWHIVAMYGPSFFTGNLIRRFGAPAVVAAGMAIFVGAALAGLSGNSNLSFLADGVLLGLGWNFGFVGASSMVLETHREEERTRVQSFYDFLVFGTTAIGSLSSGQILVHYGWDAVNMTVFPPVAVAMTALLFAAVTKRRAARAIS
jgi:MFS family permease